MKVYTSRTEVPGNEKWNLEDIYSDLTMWENDLQLVEEMAAKLKQFDGAIHDGKSLYQYLKQREELSYKFNHVYAYSMLKVDEDTRDAQFTILIRSC